jgi:hypothetical protein
MSSHPRSGLDPGVSVVVTRGWGDWRQIEVPVNALSDFRFTEFAGGTQQRLPRPTLAAYMSCEAIPEGADFGHSCEHGSGPHSIKVLIFSSHNRRKLYEQLRQRVKP